MHIMHCIHGPLMVMVKLEFVMKFLTACPLSLLMVSITLQC